MNQAVRETSKWMLDNLKPGLTILCQPQYREIIKFLTRGEFDIEKVKNFRLNKYRFDKYKHIRLGKPLFIRPRKKQMVNSNYLTGQFENHFIRQIADYKPDYIIITHRLNFMSLYLENHPNFKLAHSSGNGKIKLFLVNTTSVNPLPNFTTKFGKYTYEYLSYLYKNNRKRYETEKNIIEAILIWDDNEKQKLFSYIENENAKAFRNAYEKIETGKIY